MKAYVAHNGDRTPAGPESANQGIVFTFHTKSGIPCFFFEEHGHEIDDNMIPALPGMVGVGAFDSKQRVYVIDNLGDAYPNGLCLPPKVEPQPLEIDDDHPFFKAAKRAMESAELAGEGGMISEARASVGLPEEREQ